MNKRYGRVSLEKINIGCQNEQWAYMLSEAGSTKMWELRSKKTAAFPSLDNSLFKAYIGKDVVVDCQMWNADVLIVSDIKIRP